VVIEKCVMLLSDTPEAPAAAAFKAPSSLGEGKALAARLKEMATRTVS
jgi:hypothetical protein